LQLPLWVRESVASQLTVVMPGLNSVPDAGVHTTVTGGAPLAGVGTSNTTVGLDPPCAVTLISAGQLTLGSSITGLG